MDRQRSECAGTHCLCSRPYGYHAHCLKTNWVPHLVMKTRTWRNASWHFSSISGGLQGYLTKMEANSAGGMRGSEVRSRAEQIVRDVANDSKCSSAAGGNPRVQRRTMRKVGACCVR